MSAFPRRWILGSPLKDISLFYLCGLFIFFASGILAASPLLTAFTFVIAGFIIDSGHGYLTFWRLRWRDRSSRIKGLVAFLAIFLICFAWLSSPLKGFFSMVLYFTIFHHVRQFHGMTRWYEKLNGRFRSASSFFVLSLSLLPIVAFHFRGTPISLFGVDEFFIIQNPSLFAMTSLLWISIMLFWIIQEFKIYRCERAVEWNRVSSILFPALITAVCGFWGRDIFQVIFPLLVVHGLTYLSVIAYSIPIESRTWSPRKAWGLAVLFLLALGLWEASLSELIETNNYLQLPAADWTTRLLIAAVIAPALWHYVLDGFLWKSSDPYTRRIYAS